MMRQYELVERVQALQSRADEDLLNRAYVYAMRRMAAQKRASGDPYFAHPLEVAAILTDCKLDDATIVAAVLHDTIEDTEATREEIDQTFGREIGALVDGLTKIKRLDLVSKRAEQARELPQAAARHRRRRARAAGQARRPAAQHAHAAFMPPEKRARIAEETLDIYAPLAGRMGMQEMREELEDLAFQRPAARTPTRRSAGGCDDAHAQERRAHRGRSRRELTAEARRAGHRSARSRGAQKRPYSIWRKMERKSVAFEQLSDIFGFRVIVDTLEDCYRALGVVHTNWPMVPGPLQGLHLDAEAERLPLDPHDRDRARAASASSCRSAPRRCTTSPNTASRRTRSTRTARRRHVARSASESRAYQWLRRTIDAAGRGRQSGGVPRAHQARAVPGSGVLLHAEGPADRPAARRDADRLRLCGPHRRRQHRGRLPRSTAAWRRCSPSCTTATRSRSSAPTGRRRRPPGNRSSSPARRAPRSAAPPAPAVRAQYAGLGRQIVERAFERAGKTYSDDKLQGRPAAAGARHRSTTCSPRSGRGEMFSGDVVQGGLSRLQGGAPRQRRRRRTPRRLVRPRRAASLRFKLPRQGRGRRSRSRSAASTATCRCASRRTAAPCRATASSAS